MRFFPQQLSTTRTACNLLFAASVLALLGFILALPVFATGDGPFHLYFARIMWDVAQHHGDLGRYFAIRHLIAPYSIHYFALIFLEQVCSPAMAEKVFVALIVATTATGFRFLLSRLSAASIPPNSGTAAAATPLGPAASLWMVPLLLSWSLAGGFLNFSLAIGISYWAYGFWTMLPPKGFSPVLAAFLVCLLLLVLSHPVPLLVLFLFTGADLLLHSAQLRFHPQAKASASGRYPARLAALACTAAAMLAPALIADKGKINSIWSDLHPHLDLVGQLLRGECLGFFGGRHPLQLVYTACLLLIVPGAAWFVGRHLWSHWRAGALTPADRLFVIAALFLLASLSFPHSLNGSYYFPQRLWDLLWPMLLATTAGVLVGARAARLLAAAGAGFVLAFAILAAQTIPPMARWNAQIGAAPLPAGSKGIFLEPTIDSNAYGRGFTYPVSYWSGARALISDRTASSRPILINSPWLGLTVLPVQASAAAGQVFHMLPSADQEHPFELYDLLRTASPIGDRVLAASDWILYADVINPHPNLPAVEEALLGHNHRRGEWSCAAADIYLLCTRRR